jgi:threonine aldolase
MSAVPPNYAFASDNTAGVCPEAMAAVVAANSGRQPSYGDDPFTAEARARLSDLFGTACVVHFVFNGTAANALALAALCQRHEAVVCHELAHVDTDECGAPEFFTGGSKLLPIAGPGAKLQPDVVERLLGRGHGIHFPRVRALSLTQATELGTVYSPDELRALRELARPRGLAVHVDGARFANVLAAGMARGWTAADLTWKAGVDVLCLGGTKNGLLSTEAVVFFDHELARDFDRRVKQGGQLASKQRFASAQWAAVLRDGSWLRHAAHANRQAQALGAGLAELGLRRVAPVEANGVFVEMAPPLVAALEARGWHFYRFVGDNGYRLMCSWATRDADVAAFLADARAAV